MIEIPKVILLGAIDAAIIAHQPVVDFHLSIDGLDRMSVVSVPNDHYLDQIYVPVAVLTIGGDYYLVNEGVVVWGGHIDSEGLMNTVSKDLSTLPHLINFNIACQLNDRERLADMFTDEATVSSIIAQQAIGQEYYEQNHGGKPVQ